MRPFRIPVLPALLLPLALLLGASAHAATISVTTTDDVISLDGECSLREAVIAANINDTVSDCPSGEALPVIDEIELPPGLYSLTLNAVGEDSNAGGDLDIAEAVTLRGLGDDFVWWDDAITPEVEPLDVWGDPTGFPRTFAEEDLPAVVIENGLGKPDFPGDGDRVLHILPGSQLVPPQEGAEALVTIENLAIARGDGFCTGASCNAGSGGILHESQDDLTLRRVALFENRVSCSGVNCGNSSSAAALAMDVDADLRLLDSVIAGHVASCAETTCRTGAIVFLESGGPQTSESEIDRTLIAGNGTTCSSTNCLASPGFEVTADALRMTQTVVTDNEMSCEAAGFSCIVDNLVVIDDAVAGLCVEPPCSQLVEDVEISANRGTCDGFECFIGSAFMAEERIDQTLRRLRVQGNEQRCTGFACRTDPLVRTGEPKAGSVVLNELELLDNSGTCEGTACIAGGALAVTGSGLETMTDVTLRGGTSCLGDRCVAGGLALLSRVSTISDLSVIDSTVACTGEACLAAPLVISSSAFVQASIFTNLSLIGNAVTCSGMDCTSSSQAPAGEVGEGGILLIVSFPGLSDPFVLDGATITGNLTTASGVLASNGILEVVDSTISGNTSAADGGAIWNGFQLDPKAPEDTPGTLTLRNTAVEGNLAAGVGGGIFNPTGASLTVIGGSIDSNTATDGGGIWNEGTLIFESGAPFGTNTPNNCVDSGAGTGCLEGLVFLDGFESGETSAWSSAVP